VLRDDDLRRGMGEADRRLSGDRTWDKTLVPVVAVDRTLRARA
jgi:hypothetical protein